MSNQITEAFVQAFHSGFIHVAQQMVSRFERAVRIEPNIVGSSKSVNRLGKRTASKILNRHGDTPINDQAHSTRFLDLFDYDDGDMLDDQDKIRLLADPGNDYTKAMVAGHNRAKDDEIITAQRGSSRSTTGSVVLPSSQKIAVGAAGLTRAKCVTARGMFRRAEADEENGEELFLGYGATQLTDLLTDTTLTNSEYNTVLSLQNGTFKEGKLFGFTPIPSERYPKVTNDRFITAWAKSGTVLGIGRDIVARVGEDPGKKFNVRYYSKMSIGAVRVEEEKVVEIACLEP